VTDTRDPHAAHQAFLAAARDHGFAASPDFDFDGPRQELGAGFYQKNIRDGRRHSAAAAFLVPALARPNLAVWSHTLAHRILLRGTRAFGVEVLRSGARTRATARREIIVAAGAIESPKLLMLSGVGPAEALRRLGIGVTRDLPGVGANLQDHLKVSLRWHGRTTLPPSTVSAGLFVYSEAAGARRSAAPPDLQFYVGRGLDTPDPFVTLTIALTQPASRGRLILRSADPIDPPRIEPNYLAEPSDLAVMAEGVRLVRSFANSSAYDALRGAPADPDTDLRADADVRAFVGRTADTIFHPVGTCRMGRGSDAVVDAQLRVHGIEGLRVADASIFPTILNSQINAACVAIGDVAADLMGA
jgi:choline dehydrogenase